MVQIRENLSLRPYNSFAIEARTRYMSSFTNIDELLELLAFSREHNNLRKLILGGGSNILLTGDFNGIVLKNDIQGIEIIKEDDEYIYIKAGAGVNWHRFVMYCIENNFAGVENLALIPGSVGASPMQNIGAYGVEIKDVFESLEAIDINSGMLHLFSLNDCAFGYRESVFKNKYKGQFVITSVVYRLNRDPRFNITYGALKEELSKLQVTDLSIRSIANAVIRIRQSKLPDPNEIGNAGSFFKNPQVPQEKFLQLKKEHTSMPSFPVNNQYTKIPAGWLIEQCGWKGYRKGDAGCYSKQALVLVNYGNATGKEIWELSEEIIQSVKTRFGVLLEREVNIISDK